MSISNSGGRGYYSLIDDTTLKTPLELEIQRGNDFV